MSHVKTMKIKVCVICKVQRPPLFFLNVEYRKILEAVLLNAVNITQLRQCLLVACLDCHRLIETVVVFRRTALAGVRNLLSLLPDVEPTPELERDPLEVPIKNEPEELTETKSRFVIEVEPESLKPPPEVKTEDDDSSTTDSCESDPEEQIAVHSVKKEERKEVQTPVAAQVAVDMPHQLMTVIHRNENMAVPFMDQRLIPISGYGRGATSVKRGIVTIGRGPVTPGRGIVTVGRGVVTAGRGTVTVGRGAVAVESGAFAFGSGTVTAERGTTTVQREAFAVKRGIVTVGRGPETVRRGILTVKRGPATPGIGTIVLEGAVNTGRGAAAVGRGAAAVGRGAATVGREGKNIQAKGCNTIYPWYIYVLQDREVTKERFAIRISKEYTEAKFRCQPCLQTFATLAEMETHAKLHFESAGEYQCHVCTQRMATEGELNLHRSRHVVRYRCYNCSYITPDKDKITIHTCDCEKETHSEPDKPADCKVCGKTFINKFKMTRHYYTHFHNYKRQTPAKRASLQPIQSGSKRARTTDKPPVTQTTQPDSNTAYPWYIYILQDHEVTAERKAIQDSKGYAEAEFRCEPCLQTLASAAEMETHAKLHLESAGEFECLVCTQRMATESELNLHRSRHVVRYRCCTCSYTTPDKDKITIHTCDPEKQKIAPSERPKRKRPRCPYPKPAKCDKCGSRYKDEEALARHITRIHSEPDEPTDCKECGKTFINKFMMRRHSYQHLYDNKGIDSLSPELFCTECKIPFNTIYTYRQHLKSLRHSSTKRIECDYCGKKFTNKFSVKLHIKVMHTQEFDFKCDQCPKAYVTRRLLRRHAEKHLPDTRPRPHICECCGKAFLHKNSLKQHMNIHNGLRPYKCKLCPATFSFSGAVYTHTKLKHEKIRPVWMKKPSKKKLKTKEESLESEKS